MARINLNFDDVLLKEVDDYAKKMHLNRTSAVNVLVTTALNQEKSVDTLTELVNLVKNQNK